MKGLWKDDLRRAPKGSVLEAVQAFISWGLVLQMPLLMLSFTTLTILVLCVGSGSKLSLLAKGAMASILGMDRRQKVPAVDEQHLEDSLATYVLKVGAKASFTFTDYQNVASSQAIRGTTLVAT